MAYKEFLQKDKVHFDATEADPAVAQVCRGEEGERDGRAAPRRKNPAGVLVFLKTCVLCASFDPTFPFWGKKINSLLFDGMFTITLKTNS